MIGPLVLLMLAAVIAATPTPSVQRSVGKVAVELALPKAVFVAGEPVSARMSARNEGDSVARLRFASGQQFDLLIRQRGVLVWRWSHDKAFLQAVQTVSLRPGESLTFTAAWNQVDLQGRRVEPGDYELVGVFLGTPGETDGQRLELPAIPLKIRT